MQFITAPVGFWQFLLDLIYIVVFCGIVGGLFTLAKIWLTRN